jgi:hypothetical protein
MEFMDWEKLLSDLWMRQTDVFLKLVSLMPVIELGILAGWYALIKDDKDVLALIAALLGVIVMLIAWAYLYRATVYIEYFKNESFILRDVPERTLFRSRATGRTAGLSIPALCAGVNLLLALASTCMATASSMSVCSAMRAVL